ncbi:TIR domain-containing protein [Parvibaculum sp.]|uniref:TIR domain-containing protein n=1 Tax=Parvibaculum sp. TaxID=2024848 RepID=UPI00391B4866
MPRRTFFSFHYIPDVWRAWNVRNSWVVKPSEQADRGFFDGSVFESKKRTSDDALKAFLREGLENTTVTCVLAGAETWTRRWVRYEIARSVVRGNGLLTVDVHGIGDREGRVSAKGTDPLSALGVYRTDNGIFLAERENGKWIRYKDYTLAIPDRDLWFKPPTSTNVVPLATHSMRYDFVGQSGRNNIAGWIELAAKRAGH